MANDRNPLDDLSYDDPQDQRTAAVIREHLDKWRVPSAAIDYKDLRKNIEGDGGFFAQSMLEPRSVSMDLLKDRFLRDVQNRVNPTVDIGATTLTIPNTVSAAGTTVPHRLGKTPQYYFYQCATAPFGSYAGTIIVPGTYDAINHSFSGYNWNGYASGVVVNVHYILVAFG